MTVGKDFKCGTNKGGRIIDNLQIDNLRVDNLQVDNLQIDDQTRQIDNLQIDNQILLHNNKFSTLKYCNFYFIIYQIDNLEI